MARSSWIGWGVALNVALAYVGCGSDGNDSSSGPSMEGGASGEGGAADSGGAPDQAGSNSGGATGGGQAGLGNGGAGGVDAAAGQAGAGGSGGATAGAGGTTAGAGGVAGAGELGGASGAAGAGGDVGYGGAGTECTTLTEPRYPPSPLPSFCPGLLEDYNQVEGTRYPDVYCAGVLTSGDDFVLGRRSPDVIRASDGDDCVVGGRQYDRLEHGTPSDGVDTLHGGHDADWFVMLGPGGHAVIVDMTAEDWIVFVKDGFGLGSVSGTELPSANRSESVSDLDESMSSSGCGPGVPCIVVDASDGEIYFDADGSNAGLLDLVAIIDASAGYVLDWTDFVLED